MPIAWRWDNPEKTIIRIDISEQWSWEEFQRCGDAIIEMMNSVSYTVDTINVLHPGSRIPPGNPLRQFRQMGARLPANFGMSVAVGQHPFIISVFSIFLRMDKRMSSTLVLSTSIDEAYSIIQKKQNAAEDSES